MERIYIVTTSERINVVKNIVGAYMVSCDEPTEYDPGYGLTIEIPRHLWNSVKRELAY